MTKVDRTEMTSTPIQKVILVLKIENLEGISHAQYWFRSWREDCRQRKKNIYSVFMIPNTNGFEYTQMKRQMFLFLTQMFAVILP